MIAVAASVHLISETAIPQSVAPASIQAFRTGERIAKLSVTTLVVIGVVELSVGFLTGSLGLKADGVDSLSDSVITLIVWLGLHYSRRRPDSRFHFGYHKVESLSALIISFGMVGVAGYILYHAYRTFLNPTPITFPTLALFTLAVCGSISTYRAFQMRAVAKQYGLLSLSTDANNSIKDATGTLVVFLSVLGASLGVHKLDAIGGMVVSVYILGVAYVAMREASLILLDACESPEMVAAVAGALKTIDGVKDVGSIKLRPSGPYMTGIISVFVDGNRTISEADQLRRRILEIVAAIIEPVGEISVVFRPK
jgi:cation diffusion facilitator family transporter